MTSADYGWAQPTVRTLCELESANIGFCLSPDRATKLYVLLAIRGFERASLTLSMPDFAHDLSRVSRRKMLRRLWAFDLGCHRILKRCSEGTWGRKPLDCLAWSLGNPNARTVLLGIKGITARAVRALAAARPGASRFELELAVRFGAREAAYVRDGLARHSQVANDDTIAPWLRRAQELDDVVHLAMLDTPFPKPPWSGSETIRPIRTMRELRKAGATFQNCLHDREYGFHALSGDCVIYIALAKQIPFCVRLSLDRVLRVWRLAEIKGVANTTPTRAQRDVIVTAFGDAGFPVVPRSAIGAWAGY